MMAVAALPAMLSAASAALAQGCDITGQGPAGGAVTTRDEAADPTARHRAFYGYVNGNLESYRKKRYGLDLGPERRPFQLLTWRNGTDLVKARMDYLGKRGTSWLEFYLIEDGQMLVVDFASANGDALPAQPPFSQGSRYYFDQGGAMIKWVDETGKDVAPGSDAFQAQERGQRDTWQWLISKIKAEDEKSAGPIREFTGIFLGIEVGDYVHLRVGAGTQERSFLVLQTDESLDRLLADPDRHRGRPITVVWRRATEYLEAAGADTRIDKVQTVKLPR